MGRFFIGRLMTLVISYERKNEKYDTSYFHSSHNGHSFEYQSVSVANINY